MKHIGKGIAIAAIWGAVVVVVLKVLDMFSARPEGPGSIDWFDFSAMMIIVGIGLILVTGWIASEWGD